MLAETDLDTVLATLEAERPEVCVIDSVQTLHAADLTGAAGSVGQVREVADRITRLAKARGIAVLLVGHVTKEGALAGPRVLEHLVDCVLQFEGERERTYRTLRALKNRFGSTNDVGVFEMRSGGLVEVPGRVGALRRRGDAGARQRRARGDGGLAAAAGRGPGAGLAVRARAAAAGRATGSTATGSRSCSPCSAATRASASGTRRCLRQRRRRRARRRAGGRPGGRAGGGERRAGRDDGRRAAPLACFGEVGLTGELRSVGHPDRRLAEAREVRARSRCSRRASADAARCGLRVRAALGAPASRVAA